MDTYDIFGHIQSMKDRRLIPGLAKSLMQNESDENAFDADAA